MEAVTFMLERVAIVSLIAVCSCYAGETRTFFGRWTPPPSLRQFWKPIDESWWNKGATSKLDRHCRAFAKQEKPERIIPDMIADLKTNPSEVRWFVYLHVMLNWPQERVLHVLKTFQHSRDTEISHIADDSYADIEPGNSHD